MLHKEQTCCFTGHRPKKLPWGASEQDLRCISLKAQLHDAVKSAYENGFRHFICGMAIGCDLYFAEAVLAVKELHADVTLEAAIPHPAQAKSWSKADQDRYDRILKNCDLETMVQDHYSPGCMQRRNRYMVDRSSLIIAVYDGMPGGTRQTLEYAIKKGIPFVDIQPKCVVDEAFSQE